MQGRAGSVREEICGLFANSAGLYYPKIYNIEMDPHEDLNVGGINDWPMAFALKPVKEYLESVRKYPNPAAPNISNFVGR